MQSTSRECSGGGGITTKEGSTKNHVLNGGHGTVGTEGMTLVPRDPSRALPGWHVKGFSYFPTTEGELHSESSRHPTNSPARHTLPSAFVSVLPSSSHKGASCSRMGRKENTNAQVWIKFGERLF